MEQNGDVVIRPGLLAELISETTVRTQGKNKENLAILVFTWDVKMFFLSWAPWINERPVLAMLIFYFSFSQHYYFSSVWQH